MRKADNLPPSCAVVTKSGNLNFPEPSGPVHACNGTALPLHFTEKCQFRIDLFHSNNISKFLFLLTRHCSKGCTRSFLLFVTNFLKRNNSRSSLTTALFKESI